VSLAAVGMALIYAIKPNEQRLALMRPLSLAAIFGGLSTFTVGVVSILQGISATPSFTVDAWRHIAAGTAEAVIGLFVVFGCLTIAWLLVTVGLRRA
jgi:ABC-type transport system involved in cytochrome c biogenesis permease subunit